MASLWIDMKVYTANDLGLEEPSDLKFGIVELGDVIKVIIYRTVKTEKRVTKGVKVAYDKVNILTEAVIPKQYVKHILRILEYI